MAKTLRPLAVRALAEGFAIFAGVLLALVADDWRETRSDRREARESLAVVMADLESDSAINANKPKARGHRRLLWI